MLPAHNEPFSIGRDTRFQPESKFNKNISGTGDGLGLGDGDGDGLGDGDGDGLTIGMSTEICWLTVLICVPLVTVSTTLKVPADEKVYDTFCAVTLPKPSPKLQFQAAG
jgi:hypothetical protein